MSNTACQPGELKTRLIITGHSFGGAVVQNATTQILATRFIDSNQDKNYTDEAKGFGDTQFKS